MSHELSLTRYIDAPPSKVFNVWVERLGEWWAPKPYTTPHVDIDWWPGGRAITTMRAPDGTDLPNEGVVLEFVPGKRVVFTDAFKGDWEPTGPFFVAMFTFEPEGSGTRYTARARHWTEEARQQHEAMGFHEGWGAVADQFTALVEAA